METNNRGLFKMLIELAHLEFLLTKWSYDRTRDSLETVFTDTISETEITSGKEFHALIVIL